MKFGPRSPGRWKLVSWRRPWPPQLRTLRKGGSKGGKFGPALLGFTHPVSTLPSGRSWGRGGWVRGWFGMEVTPLHHGHTTSGTHGCARAPRHCTPWPGPTAPTQDTSTTGRLNDVLPSHHSRAASGWERRKAARPFFPRRI